MNTIKNKLTGILFASCAFFGTSCNDWLDVTPQGQVDATGLYETAKGCNSALGGIYYTLTGTSLYGKELSYGMMDVLAQYYETTVALNVNQTYYYMNQYDYEYTTNKTRINAIWSQMYQAVAECNAFIQYLEPNVDNIEYGDLMLGEAYALRAFIHMELFEMFGPVIHTTADLQKKAIAYRTQFDNVAKNFDTGADVLTYAEADLQKALQLMVDDPIKEYGRRGDANQSLLNYYNVLDYRGGRMNYFCALGLLARLEMLRQDTDKAYTYATRVMKESEGIIDLIDKAGIESSSEMGKDLNYSAEMLGAFYVDNLYTYTNALFGMDGEAINTNSGLAISEDQYAQFETEIYGREPDGSGTDNRLRYWFEAQSRNTDKTYYDLKKLKEAYNGGAQSLGYYPEIPIMRMSEIYYIACEAQIGKNNEMALDYLNDVRRTRNLADIEGPLTDDILKEYLVREARKDFIGEGRMFLMYKRLFCDIYVKDSKTIAASESNFTFPIPEDEYEFTENVKPE